MPRKLTLEEVKIRLKEINPNIEILSDEYINAHTKLKCKCLIDGNEWMVVYNSLASGNGCPKCSIKRTSEKQKLNIDLVKKEFTNRNFIPLFNEYKNNHQKLMAKTKDGYKFLISFQNLQRGQNVSYFDSRNPYTVDNIKNYIKLNNLGCELLNNEFKGINQQLKIKCQCGNIFNVKFREFKYGNKYKCNICTNFKEKLTISEVRDRFFQKGYIPLFNQYKNCKEKLLAMTKEGYKVYVSLGNLRVANASIFDKSNPYTIENIKLYLELTNSSCKLLSMKYMSSDSKLLFECSKHGKFSKSWDKILQGQRCPKCNESKGERKISNCLESNNINYKKEYRFDDCRSTYALPFDFAIFDKCNNLISLIEYDGEFHYELARFSKDRNKMKNKLKQQQCNDNLKNEYCKKNNIPLLRIPYWDFNNIEDILIEWLNNKNNKITA